MITELVERAQQRSGPSSLPGRIAELDGLRAVAILLVLGCHYPGFATRLYRLPEFGWIGVDIFFALSGYLITSILLGLRRKPTPYKTFYARRAVRIFPPYACAVAAMIVLFTGYHHYLPPLAWLRDQALFLQGFTSGTSLFFLHAIRHPIREWGHAAGLMARRHSLPLGLTGIVAPGVLSAADTYWSLSIEEYFYLLWAPIVLRCSLRTTTVIALMICLAEAFLRYCFGWEACYFCVFFRLDALIYGALLALALNSRLIATARLPGIFRGMLVCCTLGLGAILLVLRPFLGRDVRYSPLFLSVGLPLISVAAVALIGLLILRSETRWWVARVMRLRAMQWIGRISYTMYLVHILVAFVVLRLFSGLPSLESAILSSALTVLVALASWHLLESPMSKWKDRRVPSPSAADASAVPATVSG